MSQAINLANFANSLDASGGMAPSAINTPVPVSKGGTAVSSISGFISSFGPAIAAAMYPVGSIYTNASVATNPAALFGFGTWSAFGAGRVPVGVGSGFNAGGTGGSTDAVIVSHTHNAVVVDPAHSHLPAAGMTFVTTSFSGDGSFDSSRVVGPDEKNPNYGPTATSTTGITVSNSSVGVSGTNANLQPYIVVYMWLRTA
jgi:hypothetical protein